ncbi:hypothetical protein [Paenibacillus sp. MBLB4367]|uniref:hypothetical protein n=1 Tax=Paenibacillus sp. MBLB4367 TaxID=3384767 RepID=UPI0039083358
MKESKEQGKKSYLFNVSILVDGYNNGMALESLLRLLNADKIIDYKINEGIELGKIIDASLAERHKQNESVSKSQQANKPSSSTAKTQQKAAEPPSGSHESKPDGKADLNNVLNLLQEYQKTNSLVRLSALKGKGVKLSIPCRILSFDSSAQLVTVYHVDEKKVYQFHMSEIEDFHVTGS